MTKRSFRVYVDNNPLGSSEDPPARPRKSLVNRLSHDISTEQLLCDQLIDAKVTDESDEESEVNETTSLELASSQMYKIESHSHLASLVDKDDMPTQASPSSKKPRRLRPIPSEGKSTTILHDIPSKSTAGYPCANCQTSKDIPVPHAAAYAGHIECLQVALRKLQVDKYPELDKKKRTPLFYACAANRVECCVVLLNRKKEWRDLPDFQLDTPVHACCFFGRHECLEYLLNAGANPHARNAKGFKPSHLAATPECYDLLLSFGDDLLQGDQLGRTPLFVSCARDRHACVEYLCNWNHQSNSWMLEQEDSRGDRPIHAAACNGSIHSLRILLAYGADPNSTNGSEHTAKMLAQHNKHEECAQVLAAAEEEASKATTWQAPANAWMSDLQTEDGTFNDVTSMATGMKSGWIECWDPTSKLAFYYNNLSGKCQWERPESFIIKADDKRLSQASAHSARLAYSQETNDTIPEVQNDDEYVWVKKKRQTMCVAAGRDSEWFAVQDPTSRAIYYQNSRTGETQWEEPEIIHRLQTSSGARTAQVASKMWEELNDTRSSLAKALAADKHRQLEAHRQALEWYKEELLNRRRNMKKREEQAQLHKILPRSSFIRKKKQSMMMKFSHARRSSNNDIGFAESEIMEVDEKFEEICENEPALEIFLTTYLKLHGVQDVQVLTPEKRLCNCFFNYYVAMIDPLYTEGLMKSQFRKMLYEANLCKDTSSISNRKPWLRLHVVDMIFAQAMQKGGMTAQRASTTGQALSVSELYVAMQLVREKMVDQRHTAQSNNSSDDDEWFLTTYLVPLGLQLGSLLIGDIKACKEVETAVKASPKAMELLTNNRNSIQRLHRHYSAQEPKLKILSFYGLSEFLREFAIAEQKELPRAYRFYEAVNWICGTAHTDVISFEKFELLLAIFALLPMTSPHSTSPLIGQNVTEAKGEDQTQSSLVNLFQKIEQRHPSLIVLKTEGILHESETKKSSNRNFFEIS